MNDSLSRSSSPARLPEVPGYVLERRIGQGGTANVFLAHSTANGVAVAIKMVRPEVSKVLGVERFLQEIQIAGSIEHPHLVPLLGWGESDGLPYYVMPFVPGGSLRDLLDRERQLPLPAALRIARNLAGALGALHAHGIIHRDVKPENVLVGPEGDQALLADYGIARALTRAALEPLTSTGIVIGTPEYMSPEQGAGDTVDTRSDIYAWGCVLYEMLAGEAPFHGPTAQVIIGRHISEQPPNLRIVRPDLPPGVEAVVRTALAKAAADRFPNMEAVLRALDAIDLDEAPRPVPTQVRTRPRAAARIGWVLLVALAGLGVWRVWFHQPALDAHRVVVFPFAGERAASASEGEQLAILIGSALERTEPMRWLDGWSMLGAAERTAGATLPADRAETLARRAGARYFLAGEVVRSPDSVRVVVRLHDLTDRRSPVSRSAAGAGSVAPIDLALDAILELLPRLVGAGSRTDVLRLRDRNTAAVARWLQGEREYRSSRMADALALFESALAADSLLAPAALRGAMAASWINSDRADPLIGLALRHAENLSARERLLGEAMRQHLAGDADGTIRTLRRALAIDSSWADQWLLAGETNLYLLPTVSLDSLALAVLPPPRTWPLEQMAADAYARAVQLDSTFTPPLVSLAEIALRRGNARDADRLLGMLRRAGGEPRTLARLELAARCVTEPTRLNWEDQARQDGLLTYQVATLLVGSPEPSIRGCAQRGLEALLASDAGYATEDWGALVLLQSMLVAEGRPAEALAAVDSAVAGGLSAAMGLFVLDAVAGVDVGNRGQLFIDQLGEDYAARGTASLWLITIWHASQGDRAPVERIATLLAERAAESGARLDRLVAEIAGAYVPLLRGDSTAALARFERLVPTSPRQELAGSLWETLATERIVWARLLLARGDFARAHRVASVFDHPGMFIHQLFLPASLELREAAAAGLHDDVLASAASRRLEELRSPSSPGGP